MNSVYPHTESLGCFNDNVSLLLYLIEDVLFRQVHRVVKRAVQALFLELVVRTVIKFSLRVEVFERCLCVIFITIHILELHHSLRVAVVEVSVQDLAFQVYSFRAKEVPVIRLDLSEFLVRAYHGNVLRHLA